MGGLGARRSAGRCRRRLGRGSFVVFRPRRRLDNRLRWGRFRQSDVDQVLYDLGRPCDIDMEAAQQNRANSKLNENDRGERISTLPRPHCSIMLGVGGHKKARNCLAVVTALMLGRAAIDRSTRHCTADRAGGRSD